MKALSLRVRLPVTMIVAFSVQARHFSKRKDDLQRPGYPVHVAAKAGLYVGEEGLVASQTEYNIDELTA